MVAVAPPVVEVVGEVAPLPQPAHSGARPQMFRRFRTRIRRALQRPMALQEVPVDAVLQPVLPLEVVEGVLDVAAALLLPRQLYLRGRQ